MLNSSQPTEGLGLAADLIRAGKDCSWDETRLTELIEVELERLQQAEREACAQLLEEYAERYQQTRQASYLRTGHDGLGSTAIRGLTLGVFLLRHRIHSLTTAADSSDAGFDFEQEVGAEERKKKTANV